MSTHNHKCSCDHTDVKFCKCCNTVYCKGCNQEWSAKSTYWTNPYYTYGTSGIGQVQTLPTYTVTSTTTPAPTVCEHKG